MEFNRLRLRTSFRRGLQDHSRAGQLLAPYIHQMRSRLKLPALRVTTALMSLPQTNDRSQILLIKKALISLTDSPVIRDRQHHLWLRLADVVGS